MITRTVEPRGRIVFAIAGPLTHDVAKELRPMLDRDLLEARGSKSGVRFVIDLADSPDIEPRALKTLEGSTRLILSEIGAGLELINVSDDIHALLKTARFTNVFTVTRAGEQPRVPLPDLPI
jgi:hypothetical protein